MTVEFSRHADREMPDGGGIRVKAGRKKRKELMRSTNPGNPWSPAHDSERCPTCRGTNPESERARQVSVKGWTSEHDDEHADGDLLAAADCYIAHVRGDACNIETYIEDHWPWEESSWKPSDDQSRNLMKAGALIAAEIDRLTRARKSDAARKGER